MRRFRPGEGSSLSLGVDLVDLAELGRAMKSGTHVYSRILTDRELSECEERIESLGGKFAAKEAISKALRMDLKDIDLQELEVLTQGRGVPEVIVDGGLQREFEERKVIDAGVSISHKSPFAIAVAWLVTENAAKEGSQ